MKLDKKEVVHWFKKAFYLGRRKEDNARIYLEKGSWECDWYWGFGYLEVYNKPKTDIKEHYHFDSLFKGELDGLRDHFKTFVLTEKQQWLLIYYMKSFYTLREAAEIYGRGGSHYTTIPEGIEANIKDTELAVRINRDIRKIITAVEQLLTP